jgi:hypothetical protein
MLKQLFYSGPSIEVLHEEYAKKGRIDARAPVGAAGEIRIEAPVGRVWELLVNVPAWGTWGRAVAAPRAPVSILLASGGCNCWSSARPRQRCTPPAVTRLL